MEVVTKLLLEVAVAILFPYVAIVILKLKLSSHFFHLKLSSKEISGIKLNRALSRSVFAIRIVKLCAVSALSHRYLPIAKSKSWPQ